MENNNGNFLRLTIEFLEKCTNYHERKQLGEIKFDNENNANKYDEVNEITDVRPSVKFTIVAVKKLTNALRRPELFKPLIKRTT